VEIAGDGIAWTFGDVDSNAALEPKPLLIDERDHRDRPGTNVRGETRQVIEDRLGKSVEDTIPPERGEAQRFIRRQ
jgi:hypothetical protein